MRHASAGSCQKPSAPRDTRHRRRSALALPRHLASGPRYFVATLVSNPVGSQRRLTPLTSAVTENRPYAVTRNPANARLPFQAKSPALAGRCVRLGLVSLAGCEVTTVGRIASDH